MAPLRMRSDLDDAAEQRRRALPISRVAHAVVDVRLSVGPDGGWTRGAGRDGS